MSSERLPGEAGAVQAILQEQLPLDIVAEQQAIQPPAPPQEQPKSSPGAFEGFRKKLIATATIGAMAIGLCSGPGPGEGVAEGANTETAVIGMPFPGKWSSFVHPSSHHYGSADWATDVYAPPDTEAKLNVGNVSGTATYTTSNIADTSCSAGKRVRVNIKVDNVDVGWVQYEHLDTSLTNDTTLLPGSVLGKTKNWGNLPCYQVSNNNGVHLHVGMKNVQDNHSCYTDHGTQGVALAEGTNLGTIGSPNTAIQQACSTESTTPPGTTPPPTTPSTIPYASVPEGAEFHDGGLVFTKVGGSAWPIELKSTWTAADAAQWGGGELLGPVAIAEIHDHEAGYGAGNAHPPRDGTAVYVDGGNGQQYYFVRGKAFPIGVGELDELGVAGRALPVPALGSRLWGFTGQPLVLEHGEMYKVTGDPALRQVIYVGSIPTGHHVNSDTVKDCLRLTQGRIPLVMPQSARNSMLLTDISAPAGCSFPPGMVLRGPGGQEQWRIEGNNPYVRRYYPTALLTFLHTSGNPNHQVLSSVPSLNSIPQGPDMVIQEGMVMVDMSNGAEFLRQNGEWHYVPWPDMNTCLGIAAGQIVHVPGEIARALPQGSQATCAYRNRVVVYNSVNYYIDNTGNSHVIFNENVKYCIIARRATGPVGSMPVNPASQYPAGDPAYCPYQTSPGLNFVHEGTDPTVWVVIAGQDGKLYKHYTPGFCVPDPQTTQLAKYHLFRVPVGETAGIPQGPDWSPSPATCAALPGDGVVTTRFE